ncbi:putative CmcJ-like methyltransferase [Colletotrichum lupini]|nr:putative CmcJ-like methyltransferase [Colletotrichum lupini]
METTVFYVAKTPNLASEKAFSIDYPVDHVKGARRENTRPDLQPMTISPIVDHDAWKLDIHGFCILHGKAHLDPEKVYTDKASVQDAYWHDIEAIMHENFPQYSRIECFDLTVRKRDVDFPKVVRAYREKYEQPSVVVHCDWSSNGSIPVLQWCFPGNESFWEGKKFDMINVWRPLKESTDDWPLAVCDYTSVDKDNDILLTDAIRRDRVDEISVLHFNSAHKWYYVKDQGVDDLLVFRNADSEGDKARAFHAAVNNTNSRGPPRESVEVRLVAMY